MAGVIHRSNGELYSAPYHKLLREVIDSNDADLLTHFILTIGVVSNHGNCGVLSGLETFLRPNQTLRVWLISGAASRLKQMPALVAQVLQEIFDERLHNSGTM
jgi:hypothetical protein